MRSGYLKSKSEYKRSMVEVARQEIAKQKAEICPECEKRVTNQVAATFCKYLHDRYGFGRKRLLELLTTTQDMAALNANAGGTAKDAQEWLEQFIGMTLDEIGQKYGYKYD